MWFFLWAWQFNFNNETCANDGLFFVFVIEFNLFVLDANIFLSLLKDFWHRRFLFYCIPRDLLDLIMIFQDAFSKSCFEIINPWIVYKWYLNRLFFCFYTVDTVDLFDVNDWRWIHFWCLCLFQNGLMEGEYILMWSVQFSGTHPICKNVKNK